MYSVIVALLHLAVTRITPAHLPRFIGKYWMAARPAASWFLCCLFCASPSTLIRFAAMAHLTLAAFVAIQKRDTALTIPVYQRVLFYPAAAYVASLAASYITPDVSSLASLCITASQLVCILGGVIRTMLYPAPSIDLFYDVNAVRRIATADKRCRVVALPSGGDQLEALVITPNRQLPTFGQRKWMLYVGGNGELWEGSFSSLCDMAEEFGVRLLCANPRGVGRSTGMTYSADSLVEDASSAIDYLVQVEGAKMRDIVVFGHSIGGGVAGRLVSERHPELSIVFDRTFSSLTDAAIALSPLKLPPTVLQVCLRVFNFGEMDNLASYRKISHDRKLVIYHPRDQIISFPLSSLARKECFLQGGSEESKVVALLGPSDDPHNSSVLDLGRADVVKARVDALFHRKLSD